MNQPKNQQYIDTSNKRLQPCIDGAETFIRDLCVAGGPEPNQYLHLARFFDDIQQAKQAGLVGNADLLTLRQLFGQAMGMGTMQGRAWLKPYGYAGDFQIIDDIYTNRLSDLPELRRWDEFFHAGAAPLAVRNRKDYFKRTLATHATQRSASDKALASTVLKVLNMASGPCRDVAEFFEENPGAPVHITCVDQDANAIAHAQRLCEPCIAHVSFTQANALKFSAPEAFDLVWSAGLFDYFTDERFVTGLKRLRRLVKPGGSAIIGNFSLVNPERSYMELIGDWFLHHRSPEQLIALAQAAGMPSVSVESEPLGVNLFLICQAAHT